MNTQHLENTSALARTATATAAQDANMAFAAMKAHSATFKESVVGIVAEGLKMGVALQLALGHEQLDFMQFRTLMPQLDPGINQDMATRALSLAKKYKPGHEFTFAEARTEIQPFLIASHLIEAPQRAPQLPGGKITTAMWVSTAFQGLMNELKEQPPLEAWPSETLMTFVRETKKLHDEYEKAVKLLEMVARGVHAASRGEGPKV